MWWILMYWKLRLEKSTEQICACCLFKSRKLVINNARNEKYKIIFVGQYFNHLKSNGFFT
jgi:hypothetical protein